jgi:signal transduction histidine kinase
VEALRLGDCLDIRLRDDGPGCSNNGERAGGHGVGLANTRERLRVLYGDGQQFSIGNRAPRGAEVHIRLPFELAAQT